MSTTNDHSSKSNTHFTIRGALTALAVAGVVSEAGASDAVKIQSVSKPANPYIPEAQRKKGWKKVTIVLSDAQKKQLRAQGLDTDKVSITTFDISRLGGSGSSN
jgi:hypothetical protein